MDDAAPGRHPLRTAGEQVAAIAEMILVQHVSVEHVRDRLEATVRVARKTGDVVVGVVGGKLVEHQEGIKTDARALPEAAPKLDAGAVGSRL